MITLERLSAREYPGVPRDLLVMIDKLFERVVRRRPIDVTVVATTPYTVVITDDLVVFIGAAGGTIYLPNATAFDGFSYTVKHAGAGVLTVDATTAGQIFSSLGLVNTVTLAVGDGVEFNAANGSWQIT
jgi:hypothetical protein